MQSLNFTLKLFNKHGIPFKLSSEEKVERELKVHQVIISKDHVQKGHVQSYLKIINSLEKKKGKARNSLVILFEGFEHDSRRMYDVPELKSWVQKMFSNKRHLFYFMINASDNYLHDMALCLVTPAQSFVPRELQSYMSSTPDLMLNGADATPAIQKMVESAFIYAKKMKHSPEELMDLCMALLDHTHYDEHYRRSKSPSQL